MTKWVYGFGGGSADGDASMKNLLGGKGANLAEMSSLGLPVPPGFTVTTEVCTHYYANGETYPADLEAQVQTALEKVEGIVGKTFGDVENPLLVSVRSGARASMPGMMDTVLNLGLNDQTVEGLAKLSGDRRFAFDSYRRFITMYSNVVLGLSHDDFEEVLDQHKDRLGVTVDTDLTAEDWQKVVVDYKAVVERELGHAFPQDPKDQLWGAVGAVFASWMNDRAKFYRRMHDIPESWGTAVSVQSMVFGNMGETSATGVAFTRNPSTGEARLYGEFLINAQGEDVVAGIRTPQSLTKIGREEMGETAPSMEEAMPEVFGQFVTVVNTLESHYRDMQDIEFTVEQGRLWMLQTRNGKRTAKSALKVAVDLAAEGVISQEEGHQPGRAVGPGPTAAPDAGPGRRPHRGRCGPAGLARRGDRQDRLRRRRGRAHVGSRRGGDPGARGDQPGGHPRHARGARHRHRTRRHDQPRRRRGARHGTRLRFRRRRNPYRRGQGRLHREGPHLQGRRDHHHRRLQGRGAGRRRADDRAGADRRLPDPDGLGRQGASPEGPRQRRDPAGRQDRARFRRRGHRPVPHRTYVLRRQPHRCGPRNDPSRRRKGPPHGPGQDRAVPEVGLRGTVRDHGRPAGDGAPAGPAAARVHPATRTRTSTP